MTFRVPDSNLINYLSFNLGRSWVFWGGLSKISTNVNLLNHRYALHNFFSLLTLVISPITCIHPPNIPK